MAAFGKAHETFRLVGERKQSAAESAYLSLALIIGTWEPRHYCKQAAVMGARPSTSAALDGAKRSKHRESRLDLLQSTLVSRRGRLLALLSREDASYRYDHDQSGDDDP